VIDTHCHLDRCHDLDAALDTDLDALITIATEHARLGPTLGLLERDPRIFAVVGIHPNEAHEAHDAGICADIEAALAHPRVVGVGETGIDLYWDRAPLASQRDAFRWQGALAREHHLPLVLHVRDPQVADGAPGWDAASREAIALLEELRQPHGVLHCTNGHAELIECALAWGWYVSFAGNLTYPKATRLHAAAQRVPGERLLVETDAPFLAPVPKRGRHNLPGYVHHTAVELARLRAEDPQRLAAQLDRNARACFPRLVGVGH
jgi:TatD DNase family protein